MAMEPPAEWQTKLVASLPSAQGPVLIFTFAYPVGSCTSYMSIATVSDPRTQNSGRSGKFRFDDWCFVNFPPDFERIQFDLPDGTYSLFYPETVMIHISGLLIAGENRFVRHWLDVFLRERLPQRAAVAFGQGEAFLLHLHVGQLNRTFHLTGTHCLDWLEPPKRPPRPSAPSRSSADASSHQSPPLHTPQFEVPQTDQGTADEWLLQMVHPGLQEVSAELHELITEHTEAAETDPIQRESISAVQGRAFSAVLMVDNLLSQWEQLIRPADLGDAAMYSEEEEHINDE